MANINLLVTRHASGEFVEVGEFGRREGQTQQCCHCGRHWEVKPGSGTRRGWCVRCGKVTCGARACQTCVPYEEVVFRAEQRWGLWRAMEESGG